MATRTRTARKRSPARPLKRLRKGKRMRGGAKWRLVSTRGRGKVFAATLLTTINMGSQRIALFSVPKRFKDGDH